MVQVQEEKREGRGEEKCIFCEIVKGNAKAHCIYEDDLCMGILDVNPFSQGHCLMIPKRHVPWWHDLTEEETESIFKGAREVSHKIMKVFEPDFVAVYIRGRRIPHTHIFLVPTYEGDVLDRFFNSLEGFQESVGDLARLRDEEDKEKVAEKLRSV